MELELEKKSFPFKHILVYIIEFGFVFNIVLLDIFVIKAIFFTPTQNQAASTQQNQVTVLPSPTATPPSQLLPTPTPINPTPVIQTRYINTSPQVKEYYIPLGTGQTESGDWQDISGASAYVDSANYPNIKQVVFEVTAHVPNATQDVQVRLFDQTDQHPIWYSDISFSGLGNTSQLVTSAPITLDVGNKLYSVQMKTQLQATTLLDQARIHITLQ